MSGANLTLPPLSLFAARSTYLTLIPAIDLFVQATTGSSLPVLLGLADQGAVIDEIMKGVDAVMVLLGWGQRFAPNFRLNLTGK